MLCKSSKSNGAWIHICVVNLSSINVVFLIVVNNLYTWKVLHSKVVLQGYQSPTGVHNGFICVRWHWKAQVCCGKAFFSRFQTTSGAMQCCIFAPALL